MLPRNAEDPRSAGAPDGLAGRLVGVASLGHPYDSFARRLILECLQESSALWWERRAVQFERVGNERCDEVADACRNKALFLRRYGNTDDEADLELVLAELEGRRQPRRLSDAA